ncbi:MAG: hypothetical protein M1838_002269 [Thelocarpon superellum]|nr:MAG: hypothetical protein M1838_002269 [Thelocarpon superellum]
MQGFNMGRYVPPEHEGTVLANKLAGKHPLGARGRKAGQGILTVRFEMPFAVWCSTCPKETIIGQGVRFNAEKRKVGNYYSTPIYAFRMKHTVCGGTIEIRTDPQNTAYVVTEGGKKRDTGEDKEVEGTINITTEEERERRRNDAFAALEGKVEDKRRAQTEHSRVEELRSKVDQDWADPYAQSQRLRKTFRAGRKRRAEEEKATEALRDRMNLSIDLLAENDDDRLRASLVEFGETANALDDDDDEIHTTTAVAQAKARPLFAEPPGRREEQASPRKRAATTTPSQPQSRSKGKEAKKQETARRKLAQEIRLNSRAVRDPFLLPAFPSNRGSGGGGGSGGGNDEGGPDGLKSWRDPSSSSTRSSTVPKLIRAPAAGKGPLLRQGGDGRVVQSPKTTTTTTIATATATATATAPGRGLVDYDSD